MRYFGEEGAVGERSSELIALVGPPKSGKTTVAGEILRILQHEMAARYRTNHRAFIRYIPFEDAQRIVSDSGYPRDDNDNSVATAVHYSKVSQLCEERARAELKIGRWVVMELPGMADRGDEALMNIAMHDSLMSDIDYNVSFNLLTPDDMGDPNDVRSQAGRDISLYTDSIESTGTEVVLDQRLVPLGGGNPEAVARFYNTLDKTLHELVVKQMLSANQFTGPYFRPSFFQEGDNRSTFIEQIYSNYLFGEVLRVNPRDVFVGRNRFVDQRKLYADDLDKFNVFSQ